MTNTHVFPWWAGYLLMSPMRKRRVDPRALLGAYIRPGMTVLDAGCAMGFFSLPIAGMVGPGGRVVCVDVQKRMIAGLRRRAAKTGLLDRIDARVCTAESLLLGDLAGRIDFALAFGVVHEVGDRATFFAELHRSLAHEGRLLVAEPKMPVPAERFRETVDAAIEKGFTIEDEWEMTGSRCAVFTRSR